MSGSGRSRYGLLLLKDEGRGGEPCIGAGARFDTRDLAALASSVFHEDRQKNDVDCNPPGAPNE